MVGGNSDDSQLSVRFALFSSTLYSFILLILASIAIATRLAWRNTLHVAMCGQEGAHFQKQVFVCDELIRKICSIEKEEKN